MYIIIFMYHKGKENEILWSAGDTQCTAAGGTCMVNTNYCQYIQFFYKHIESDYKTNIKYAIISLTRTYTNGKCGGPPNRLCCQKIEGLIYIESFRDK